MFPYGAAPEESTVRPLADEDQQLLLGLVHKYGASSVLYALTGYGEPCKSLNISIKYQFESDWIQLAHLRFLQTHF